MRHVKYELLLRLVPVLVRAEAVCYICIVAYFAHVVVEGCVAACHAGGIRVGAIRCQRR